MNRCIHIVMALTIFFHALTASAANFNKAQTLLDAVSTGLTALSLVTVTLATLWVGYKVLFGGRTLRECASVIMGAILIASASEIANMLVK